MTLTQITDHEARAVARLLQQYKGATGVGVREVLQALAGEVQSVEDALWTVLGLLPNLGVVNLAPNSSFEIDSNGDGMADSWAVYNWSGDAGVVGSRVPGVFASYAQRIAWSVANTGAKGVQLSGGGGLIGGWKALTTYVLSVTARGEGGALGSQMIWNWNTNPATISDLLNPPLTSSPQRYARRITWGGSVEPNGNLFLSIAGSGQTNAAIEVDGVLVTEGPTLYDYAPVGAALDLVGKIVGEPRAGSDDPSYLVRIKARIRVNRSSGSIDDLISLFQALQPTATLNVREDFPAAIAMKLSGVALSVPDQHVAMLRQARKGGVRSVLEYSTAPLGSGFRFAGGAPGGGKGFPDAALTPGSGGKLAGVKE